MSRFLILLLLVSAPGLAADWKLHKQDKEREIRVYLRDQPDRVFHDVYAVTQMPGTVAQVEAVLADIPAMPQWASRVSQARLLKRQKSQAWIYIAYRLPYPFKPRDAVVLSKRTRSDDAVTIRLQAIPGLVSERPETIRLESLESTWKLSPAGTGQVKVELWGVGEPGGLIPAMLYNYNLADDVTQTLRQMRRMALRPKYQDAR